jgi:transmembrane sensor
LNQSEFLALLEKYNAGNCTEDELQQMHAYLDDVAKSGEEYIYLSLEDKAGIRESIRSHVFSGLRKEKAVVKKISRRIIGSYIAAASVLLFIAGWYFFATPADQIITIASLSGQTLKHQLPDGSTVWLNDSSVITYNKKFTHNRSIELIKGEVFFDVKKDPAHPFVVLSNDISTTVKGTSFSVKLISRTSDVKVSVVTGRVAISNADDTLEVLFPGERLKYDHQTGKAIKDSVINDEANAWMNGEVLIQNASINEIMQCLE